MKKKRLIGISTITILLILMTVLSGCAAKPIKDNGKMTVAVSITPEEAFVEKVAGDLVNIITIIPSGNSPANYQPTTAEMRALSDASVYFVMQVPTEEANILPKVTDFNKNIELVNLRDAVSGEYPMLMMGAHSHGEEENAIDELHNEETESADPHIWLSPKRVILMVETIRDTLIRMDTENAEVYTQNASIYIEELKVLDQEIEAAVSAMDHKAFMIYHGSYGYFADDYGLEMISLEVNGKAASATLMAEAVERAKAEGITHIFYQDEFDDHQAKTVAEEIDGVVVKARPLAPDYTVSLREFAAALAKGEQ